MTTFINYEAQYYIVIYEERNLEIFEYTSNELSPGSTKPIVVICENCGHFRIIRMQDHKTENLCRSCAGKKAMSDTTVRNKMSISHTGKKHSEEHCQSISAGQKKRWEDPALHEKQSETFKKIWNDPTFNKKISDIQKNGFRDPAEREKTSAAVKKAMNNTTREKLSISRTGKPHSEETKRRMSATRQGILYDEWESFACESSYCPKIDDACRESNREKYNRCCFLCNKTEEENGRRLSVHHVDMNKTQGCNDTNWKLVPLCSHHHGVSHNEVWEARIEYLLTHVWCCNVS